MDFFCFRPSIGSSRSVSSTFPPPSAVKRSHLTKRLHLPEYITQTDTGLFIFRMKVPSDCRHVLHRSVLKFSLRTRCIYTARKHVASLLQYLDSFFVEVRAGAFVDAPVDVWETLKSDAQQIVMHGGMQGPRHLSPNDAPQVAAKGCTEAGNAVHEAHQVSPGEQSVSPSVAVAVDNLHETKRITFTSIKEAFFKEKEASDGWRLKTREDHEAVFSLFVEVFGDVIVDRIDKALVRDFKATIMRLPPNMRKVAKYREKAIAEILGMNPKDTLSAHTVNKYLSRLSNLFSYAVSHGYMVTNPAGGLKVKLKSRPDEERNAYTTADLKRLFVFGDSESLNSETAKPYYKWAPLIALFTGCRLEEICQLHLEDIRQEEGVLVFDINDKHEKKLKNLSSARLVPVHPQLIDAGLIQYVYELKARGEARLFPELHQRRDGYGQTVSKWFQRYKVKCGIEEGKTFHSFRHTFITHLKHKQVDPYMIHEIDGHTIESETMGRYGKRYTPAILLNEAILKIDYGI